MHHMVIGGRCWSCVRWCIELCAVPSTLQSDHNLMSRGARINVESDSMSPAKSPALKCRALRRGRYSGATQLGDGGARLHLTGAEVGPLRHQPHAVLKLVSAAIGACDLAASSVGKRKLDHFAGEGGALGGPGREGRAEAVHRDAAVAPSASGASAAPSWRTAGQGGSRGRPDRHAGQAARRALDRGIRQRHAVLLVHLHARRRHRPGTRRQVDLGPVSQARFASGRKRCGAALALPGWSVTCSAPSRRTGLRARFWTTPTDRLIAVSP